MTSTANELSCNIQGVSGLIIMACKGDARYPPLLTRSVEKCMGGSRHPPPCRDLHNPNVHYPKSVGIWPQVWQLSSSIFCGLGGRSIRRIAEFHDAVLLFKMCCRNSCCQCNPRVRMAEAEFASTGRLHLDSPRKAFAYFLHPFYSFPNK